MTIRCIIACLLVLLMATALVADPNRPERSFPITSNDKDFLDRRVQEIYRTILDYVDTLNQLRRDTANAALIKINLYDDTASLGLYRASLYDDTASKALWNTGNNIVLKRVNADTVKSHNSDGDLYLEVGTGIVVIRDLNDNGPGQLYFREKPSNGTSYIGLEAPASLSASKLFVLPSADGTSGQVISTNGSGTLSFATRPTQTEIHDSLSGIRTALWSKYGDTIQAHGFALLPPNQYLDTISLGVTFSSQYYTVTLTACWPGVGVATNDSLFLGSYPYNLSTTQFIVRKKYSEEFYIQWIASGN